MKLDKSDYRSSEYVKRLAKHIRSEQTDKTPLQITKLVIKQIQGDV